MKKIISGIVAVAVLMGIATTSVNAASVNANKTEVKKGEQVVVSVNLENATQAVDINLSYDNSKFNFISCNTTLGELTKNVENGVVKVSGASAENTTKQVNFVFEAKENTDGESFKASGLVTESGEEFTNDNVVVKVVEEQQKPTEPTEPTKPTEPTEPTDEQQGATEQKNTTTQTTQKVDENGKVITKLPQTGMPYVVLATVGVLAVAGIVVARKINK